MSRQREIVRTFKYDYKMVDRILAVPFVTFRTVVAFSFSAMLAVGCSGDIYDKQAALYEDYRSKLDTVSSYESLKNLNKELNTAVVATIKGNSEEVALSHKEAAKHKEGIKSLVKAESEYSRLYHKKVMDYVLPKQVSLYKEYTEKVENAQSYDELVKLNRALSGEVSKLGTENNNELKRATALKMCQEQFAELNKVGEAFKNAYIRKTTPLVYVAEAAIYDKYTAKLSSADDYRQLKEIKLFLDKEIAMFTNDNAMLQIAPDAYVAEKEVALKAKESFLDTYMSKVAMPLIEHQKSLYSGTATVFSTVKSKSELDALKADFLKVNKMFLAENKQELDYIAAAIKDGNRQYRIEMEEVNSLFSAIDEAMAAKSKELGK